MMKRNEDIVIDIESYWDVNISKCGVYKYASSPAFEILLFGYAVDGGDVRVVDLACGEQIPDEILSALSDASVTKWAFNAMFERVCLSKPGGMAGAGRLALYDGVGCHAGASPLFGKRRRSVGIGETETDRGQRSDPLLLRSLQADQGEWRQDTEPPEHDPEKWKRLKAYNLRDVETEMQIQKRLSHFPVPDAIWEEYHLDQEINDRGIGVDMELVRQAIAIDTSSVNG